MKFSLIWENFAYTVHYRLALMFFISHAFTIHFREHLDGKVVCHSKGGDGLGLPNNDPACYKVTSSASTIEMSPATSSLNENGIVEVEQTSGDKYQKNIFTRPLIFLIPFLLYNVYRKRFIADILRRARFFNEDSTNPSVELQIRDLARDIHENKFLVSVETLIYIILEFLATAFTYQAANAIMFILYADPCLSQIFKNQSALNSAAIDTLCKHSFSHIFGLVFLFHWFLFQSLFYVSLCNFMYLYTCMCVSWFRWAIEISYDLIFGIQVRNQSYLKLVKSSCGNWFLLSILKRKLETSTFQQLTDAIQARYNDERD